VATQEGVDAVATAVITRLGLDKGHIVQEFGYDGDVDELLRSAIEETTGESLVDEGFGDVTDRSIVWFRDGDDDLADLLMDVQTMLDDGGSVLLLTPKAGNAGHVQPRDVEESSSLAGLHATSTFVLGDSWSATHLVAKGQPK
jgi:hypothetical protein